jgi:hypothetical protein
MERAVFLDRIDSLASLTFPPIPSNKSLHLVLVFKTRVLDMMIYFLATRLHMKTKVEELSRINNHTWK